MSRRMMQLHCYTQLDELYMQQQQQRTMLLHVHSSKMHWFAADNREASTDQKDANMGLSTCEHDPPKTDCGAAWPLIQSAAKVPGSTACTCIMQH